MKGLKKSKLKARYGLSFYEIPNQDKLMFAISKEYITVVGWDDRGLWFALGNRDDLKPEALSYKDFGLSSIRSTDKQEREDFIDRVLTALK